MSGSRFERVGKGLLASPSAVFVAVLTAGFATASLAQHAGLYVPDTQRQTSVVLACPRTKECPAKSVAKAYTPAPHRKAAAATATAQSAATAPATTVASNEASAEKHASAKSTGLSVPLPDFSTPELSRFISPL